MKYIRKTKKDITSNFLEELLIDRGILSENDSKEFRKAFFYPEYTNELDFNKLDHMQEGYELLRKHMTNGSQILLVVDPDVDGYTSSALFYNYLTDVYKDKDEFNFTLSYHIPDGKEHGLETLMKDLTHEKVADLIVCPDSGR